MTAHPAKFTASIVEVLTDLLYGAATVLDPFAGTGRIHDAHPSAVGVELEPEWASMHPRTVIGDATRLPFADQAFDAVATSPCYGNRMADHHNARDGSRRYSYTHTLGRTLHPRNSGRMQWGEEYRALHVEAWAEAHRVLRCGGRLIVNVSDHVRAGAVIPVTDWHRGAIEALGMVLVDHLTVPTPRLRNGANHRARVEHESVLVFVKVRQ